MLQVYLSKVVKRIFTSKKYRSNLVLEQSKIWFLKGQLTKPLKETVNGTLRINVCGLVKLSFNMAVLSNTHVGSGKSYKWGVINNYIS